jgi:hypothetical protein
MRFLTSPALTQAIPQMPIPPSPPCQGGNRKAPQRGQAESRLWGKRESPPWQGGLGGIDP